MIKLLKWSKHYAYNHLEQISCCHINGYSSLLSICEKTSPYLRSLVGQKVQLTQAIADVRLVQYDKEKSPDQ